MSRNQIDAVAFVANDGSSLPAIGTFKITTDPGTAAVYTLTQGTTSDGGALVLGYDNDNFQLSIPGGSNNAQIQALVDSVLGANNWHVTGDFTSPSTVVLTAIGPNLGSQGGFPPFVIDSNSLTLASVPVSMSDGFVDGVTGANSHQTSDIAYNASQSDLQTALDDSQGNTGGNTIALVGADAAAGFSNTFGGTLANTALVTWVFDVSALFATVGNGTITNVAAGVTPVSEVQTITIDGTVAEGSFYFNNTGTHAIPFDDDGTQLQIALNAEYGTAAVIAGGSPGALTMTWVVAGPQSLPTFVVGGWHQAPAGSVHVVGNVSANVSIDLDDAVIGTWSLDVGVGPQTLAYNASAADVQSAANTNNQGLTCTVTGTGTVADPWVIQSLDGTLLAAPLAVTATNIDARKTAPAPNVAHSTPGIDGAHDQDSIALPQYTNAGTFDLTGGVGSVTNIAWNADAATIKTAIETNTGKTLSGVTGTGAYNDPWVGVYAEEAPETELDADWSNLKQTVIATPTTTQYGNSAVASGASIFGSSFIQVGGVL